MPDAGVMLARYRPLFAVTVEHAFFADGASRGMRVEPDQASARVLARSGCLWRAMTNGVSVYCDVSRLELCESCLAESQPPFSLRFLGYADDPLFDAYTGGYTPRPGSILAFDGSAAVAEAPEQRLRLHQGECVSGEYLRAAEDSEWPADALGRRVLPKFSVRIGVERDELEASARADGTAAKCYVLRFAARETIWRYYLLGGWAKEQVRVVDLNDKIGFVPDAAKRFSNGRVAHAVRSQEAIALQEAPPQRFQLRAREEGKERVIVKRLPVASAGQFHIEVHEGAPTWVSEIYVNC